MPRFAHVSVLVALGCAAGCGRDVGVLALDLGRETATLSSDPKPTRWELGFAKAGAERVVVAQGDWPSSSLDVDVKADEVGAFDVSFLGAADLSLAVGASPAVAVGQLPGRRLPLFVQRRGEFARPTPDLDARVEPVATVVAARIVVVGGGDTSLAGFDLALVQALAPQSLQSAPDALAASAAAVFASTAGVLVRLDLETAITSLVTLPSNVNASELSAAPLVPRAGGFAWVGPARSSAASSAIVLIDADETLRVTRLPALEHDCAVASRADGSLTLACANGAWQIAADGTVSTAPLPALGGVAALAALEDGTLHAVSAGRVIRIPVGCEAGCVPEDLGAAACAARAQMVGLGTESLLVCDDAEGATHAFRVQGSMQANVMLREPRRGATLVSIAAHEAALVGGGPRSFERYRPLSSTSMTP